MELLRNNKPSGLHEPLQQEGTQETEHFQQELHEADLDEFPAPGRTARPFTEFLRCSNSRVETKSRSRVTWVTSIVLVGLALVVAVSLSSKSVRIKPPFVTSVLEMPEVVLVQTVKGPDGDKMATKAAPTFGLDDFDMPNVIEIKPEESYQEILGFGGAFTEAAAIVFSRLTPELRQQILEAYWGSDSIGYTTGRVHMNSCDFSMASYNFDDVANDFDLVYFDTEVTHDTATMIPFMQEALAIAPEPLRIFASPWSPPGWMKTNGLMVGSLHPGLKPDAYSAWALYFSKFITAYASYGINIWGVTVQNEPEFAAPWEACCYTAEEETSFVKDHLGPRLEADHPDVKIIVFDHNKDHVYDWSSTIFGDPEASQYVDGIGVHWYAGDHFDHMEATFNQIHNKGKFTLGTEACYELGIVGTTTGWLSEGVWDRGEGYAHDILGDLNHGASGWTDWNLILDHHGGPNHLGNFCDAAIIADTEGQKLHLHPQFWYMGHISKYVTPGAVRLGHTLTLGNFSIPHSTPSKSVYGNCRGQLEVGSFLRLDGQFVVVVMNCANHPVDFKLKHSDKALRASIPARAIQTYVYAAP